MQLDKRLADPVEDRRAEPPTPDMSENEKYARERIPELLKDYVIPHIPRKQFRPADSGSNADQLGVNDIPQGALPYQAGANDIQQYAEGGPVDDDGDNDADTSGSDGDNAPAIPTDDQTGTPSSMEDGQDGQAQQPTPVPSSTAPIPNPPQSPNPVSELLALVRAVNQYGLHMAQQADASGGQGNPTQQVGAYEHGGVIRSFEEGGDTDYNDPSGAIPMQPTAANEALPAMPQGNFQQGDPGGGVSALPQGAETPDPAGPFRGQVGVFPPTGQRPQQQSGGLGNSYAGKLIRYLMGDKAADAQTGAAVKYAVDKDGSQPPHVVNQKAVQYAYVRGMENGTGNPTDGMDPAQGMLQLQRREYDMWRTAAAVKLQHGDVGQAIEAANKAFAKGPFSHGITFRPATNGVTGIVTDDNGQVIDQNSMTADQFASWLKTGAQFDKLLHEGVGTTLNNHILSSQPQPAAPQGPKNYLAGDDPLAQQAYEAFPWASQGPQRARWLAQQQLAQQTLDTKRTQSENQQLTHQLDREQRSRIAAENNAGRDRRQDITELNRNARQQNSLHARLQMHADRMAVSGTPADKNDARVIKQLIDLNPNDPNGLKKALDEYRQTGVLKGNYGSLVDTGTGPSGQPQGTPQAGGGGGAGAPAGGPQGGARAITDATTAAEAGFQPGQKVGNLIWNGKPTDRVRDLSKWTKAQ